MLRGRFEVKLDAKGRLSLPSSMRRGFPQNNVELIITNSRFQGHACLDVYSFADWSKLERKVAKMPQLKHEVQAFQRFYISGGQAVELDSQDRFGIPQSLRRYAGLQSDVILVGLGQKFEIWNAETWAQIYTGLTAGFEDTLNVLAAIEDENK